jgi:hypothetical protein
VPVSLTLDATIDARCCKMAKKIKLDIKILVVKAARFARVESPLRVDAREDDPPYGLIRRNRYRVPPYEIYARATL